MKNKIVLSDRLTAAASMVTKGNRVCDVGCDHAFVPIYLVNRGISPYVIAMDVREGPLEQAREHIKEYALGLYIDTRLSDGLECYKSGEADSLICAGMGGRLMMNILGKDIEKTASFKELILQPQSEIQQFRQFLRYQGYLIIEENMIEEGGKFYTIIKAHKSNVNIGENENKTLTIGDSFGKDAYYIDGNADSVSMQERNQRLEDRYGAYLIQNRHPVLCNYIKWEIGVYESILSELGQQELHNPKIGEREHEIESKLKDAHTVLEIFNQS